MAFEKLFVKFINDRFAGIKFSNIFNYENGAMADYNLIKNTISTKYKITPEEPYDSDEFSRCNIFGHNDSYAGIVCYRGRTLENSIVIYTTLIYLSTKDFSRVSDEI